LRWHCGLYSCGRDRAFLRYSENWQLVINTGTTIVTFLMVFLISKARTRTALRCI